jgi:hypothetical protein
MVDTVTNVNLLIRMIRQLCESHSIRECAIALTWTLVEVCEQTECSKEDMHVMLEEVYNTRNKRISRQ